MYNQMNDIVSADTEEIEGQQATISQPLANMSNDELTTALEDYIEMEETHHFLGIQLEGLSDFWAENVFEENQQQMDDGEIPMTSMYSPFFTFHRGGNRRMNARQEAFRYWEHDRDLGNSMGMPPYAAVRHNTIQDIHDLHRRGFEWLLPHGARQEQVDYLEEYVIERANERERYDGGWAYWSPSNQRRPQDHPLYDDMVQEMIDQSEGSDTPLTEMSDGTFTGDYSEFLTDDNFLNGYYTTMDDMDQFQDEVSYAAENGEDMQEAFINSLPQAPVGEPTIVDDDFADNRTGEEDLIALPTGRIPLEDKVRVGRDIINP